MSPWQPLKPESSMTGSPGVRVLLQASVMVGSEMASSETCAKQLTVVSFALVEMEKSAGTMWYV